MSDETRKDDGEIIGVPTSRQLVLCPFTDNAMLPSTPDARPICTWSLQDAKGRAMLHQIIAGKSASLWDMCDGPAMEVRVAHMAAHFTSWESEDRPGEVIAGPMITVVGPDGNFHTGSPNVYESLRQLILIEGPPPWEPPVVLLIERATTRNKRTRCVVTYRGRDE